MATIKVTALRGAEPSFFSSLILHACGGRWRFFLASSVRSRTVVRFFRPQLPPTSPLFGSLPLGIMPPASDQIHRPQLKAFLGNQSSEEEELQPERKRGNKIRMEYLGAENERCVLTRAENYPSRAGARWLLNP